jgi:gamma-glutamylcyclotransferase (GGCT)/AIG2-like uncharacterized protein YtfP
VSSGGFFHLFTYGTLGAGERAGAGERPGAGERAGGGERAGAGERARVGERPGAGLLAGCERVAEGEVAGTLYDLGDYPALLLAGTQRVRGVVWRCPVERLAELDRYEGTGDGLFRRAAVRVGGVPCWVYVAGPRLGPRLTPSARIESGAWRPGDSGAT